MQNYKFPFKRRGKSNKETYICFCSIREILKRLSVFLSLNGSNDSNYVFADIHSPQFFNGVFTDSLYPVKSPALTQNPQQVRISLSGKDHMQISWITLYSSPPIVYYGTTPGNYTHSAKATKNTYRFLNYDSDEIHNAIIGPLAPTTSYNYRCGTTNTSSEFSFKTPPSQFPIKFAVVGDLGQSAWTSTTLDCVAKSNYVRRSDPARRLVLRRHEPAEVGPVRDHGGATGEPEGVDGDRRETTTWRGSRSSTATPFTSYNARWAMPYEESASPSNLFYSFEAAGVHVIMLGSYADFGPGSDQLRWLRSDLGKVDRKRTPWLVAAVHAPWYNSNNDHQQEYESVGMKRAMEDLLFGARVDVVFAGHVHAYERFVRVYKEEANECGPMYITVGTGGNHEGLATWFMEPQPKISAFREAKYGHGQFSVINGSHAVWTWHRNSENLGVETDRVVIRNLASIPSCAKANL